TRGNRPRHRIVPRCSGQAANARDRPQAPAAPSPLSRLKAGLMKAALLAAKVATSSAASMLIAATTAHAVRWSAGGTGASCVAGARLPPDQPAAAATQAPADL